MAQELKPGSRWTSVVDDTEMIVVKAGASSELRLECGGHPMLPASSPKSTSLSLDTGFSSGTAMGKRFEHESGLDLLCTKGGPGSLAVNGTVLLIKSSKPLPSSD